MLYEILQRFDMHRQEKREYLEEKAYLFAEHQGYANEEELQELMDDYMENHLSYEDFGDD